MGKIQCTNCGKMIRETDRRCLYCNMLNDNYRALTPESIDTLENTKRWNPADINVHKNVNNSDDVKVVYTTRKTSTPVLRTIKIILGVVGSIFALVLLGSIAEDIAFSIDYAASPHSGYYLDDEDLYYFDGLVLNENGDWVERWWICNWNQDKTSCTWEIYEEGQELDFILDFDKNDTMWTRDIEEILGVSADVFDIELDKQYLDKGGRLEPQTGYYFCNNNIYFYLKADWEIEEQYTGWYAYQESTQSWHFHSKYDFKGVLDELLYYYPDKYFIGNSDASWRTTSITPPASFLETEWYQTSQAIENQRK